MSEGLQAILNDDGVFEEYDDTYDLTIHCKSKEEQEWVLNKLNWQWIPVSKRLPEERKEVIVTDIETSDTYLSRYIGNGYWECDNGTFKNRIIAWQPKPQPYKG